MNKAVPDLRFTEWARVYGDIYSLKIGPGTAIVITSMEAVKELMEKRSGSTVDRPPNYIAENVTGGLNMVLARYGKYRMAYLAENCSCYSYSQYCHCTSSDTGKIAESTQVMYDLLKTPESRYETHEATTLFEAQHLWELALEPGAHPPVDILPFLRHVPRRWASGKAICEKTRKTQRELYFGLLDECTERLKRGEENGCYMEEVNKRQDEFGLNRELSGYLGGVMIEAGSDTTSSFLQSLILLLIAFPDAQRKAHEEMDRVVGDQKAPTLDDALLLPYIQAIIEEVYNSFLITHRMRPVASLAAPLANLEVETFRGHFIPEGLTIFVNTSHQKFSCIDIEISFQRCQDGSYHLAIAEVKVLPA
ncbi:cytochrome P450 [Lentinula aciculospora]|uniref:Cytochrome P450 n=1 Tax=Lentinula aciculospora TaxID=153920 RepID=A0A9W9DD81_9AGAR|nr:cytochrome P450 [Lentinula aciculospora]